VFVQEPKKENILLITIVTIVKLDGTPREHVTNNVLKENGLMEQKLSAQLLQQLPMLKHMISKPVMLQHVMITTN